MPAGLHIVSKRKPGKPVVHYVYAWRGGPQIARKEGGSKPTITAELTDAAARVRPTSAGISADTIDGLIARYTSGTCAEWKRLASTTRVNYTTWHVRISEEFGAAPLKLFADRRIRGDVLEWRDRWAGQPRSADAAITAFSALLSWGMDRGLLPLNVLLGTDRLYDQDRSDIIWEPAHFEAFAKEASVEVQEAVDLAAATGLRRSDLVELPWAAIGDHAIVWRTSKSRGRNLITVPLLPETKELLARIKARHATEMAAKPESKRKPLPDTVLSNSRWVAWTRTGLGSRFNDAKQASGITVHLHDLRGTFATRCMLAGLTDQEISDILGWATKDVAAIRAKYVSSARVVVAIGERIAAMRA